MFAGQPSNRPKLLISHAPAASLILAVYVAGSDVAIADHGSSAGCDNMFALGLARQQHLPDCDQPLQGVVAGDYCWDAAAGMPHSPNSCAAKVYLEPPAPKPVPVAPFEWRWLSPCANGRVSTPCAIDPVRCVDGTRPGFYIDWATDDSGAPAPSDRWLFYWSGGGGCASTEACWSDFNFDIGATSTCNPSSCPVGAGRSIVDAYESRSGILSASPENDFHDWNRVRFEKCSDDSYQGTTTETGGAVTAGAIGEVYHHGQRILRRAFRQFAHPDNFPGLPKLGNASAILLAGNSGGGKTLILTGDSLRDFLITEVFGGPDTGVRIRLLVDSQFLPALEHENALIAATHLYDGDQWFTPAMGELLPESESPMAGRTFGTMQFVSGRSFQSIQAFAPPLDASCLDAHPLSPEHCHDEQHVLLHHLTTPAFIRMDINDNAKRNVAPAYADDQTYDFVDTEFHDRVFGQLITYLERFQSQSELALGLDPSPSFPTGNARRPGRQNLAVWAPKTSKSGAHTGMLDPEHFGLPSATDPVALEACDLATGKRGTASPETGFLEGPPITVMAALSAWASGGTAIDAVVDYHNTLLGYLWQRAGAGCAPDALFSDSFESQGGP